VDLVSGAAGAVFRQCVCTGHKAVRVARLIAVSVVDGDTVRKLADAFVEARRLRRFADISAADAVFLIVLHRIAL